MLEQCQSKQIKPLCKNRYLIINVETYLSGLAMLHVHGDINPPTDETVEWFAKTKKKKLRFNNLIQIIVDYYFK